MLLQGLRSQPEANVVVDASALAKFDSSALAVLLECRRESMAMGRSFAVRNLPARLSAMPGLLPNVDPEGLLEFSVVYTDRALNHMSRSFQGVMKDISAILKEVYGPPRWLVPGSGTFGMESVARQFAAGKDVLVLRNGWFSYRWTQIFEMGNIPASSTVLKARKTGSGPPPLGAGADRRSDRRHPREEAGGGVRAARGNRQRHDPARRLHARRGRRRARGRRPVRARLHRLRRDVGRHEGLRRRRADLRAAKGLEQLALLRDGDAERARPRPSTAPPAAASRWT
jgi:hypothetical protein